jgi:hypothetical protein
MRGVRQARQDQEGAEQHQRRQTAFDGDAQAGLFGFAKSLGQLPAGQRPRLSRHDCIRLSHTDPTNWHSVRRRPGQDSGAFGGGYSRALRQHLERGAADRMIDGHERISIGAEHTRHEVSRAHEFSRHDGDRRYSQPVAGHRVMQTA